MSNPGFLEQSAVALWHEYGEEVSTLKLVFPSRRARLFFGESLSKLIEKPIWEPEYLSIDDFIWQLSSLQPADNLRLVAELYTIYSRYHNEPFDKFYGWGVMLLQDFDTIDKYMVDARGLFANIADLTDIEQQFGADSPELKIVSEFWGSFSQHRKQSEEQAEFLRIWHTLGDIYEHFKERLMELGVAYPGMSYRFVAENIKALYTERKIYYFLGFNALNECEQLIFSYLKDLGDAHFLWDYSDLYVGDNKQEAGRFIRRNIAKFPEAFPLLTNHNADLKIGVISSPTDVLQCKALTVELEEIFRRQGYIDKETAVVLTNENLLQPVLNSIPNCVERVNITMGFPVVNSLAYNLLERLLQLQVRKRDNRFYYKDVLGILSHQYINEISPIKANDLVRSITENRLIYIEQNDLGDFNRIFTMTGSPSELQEYLLNVFSYISDTKDPERREFTYSIISSVSGLAATIQNCEIQLTTSIYTSLLRQMLANVRIPYTGEPLGGLQILGILETRNLDFANVIMLSLNDDNFPGNRSGQSYIPYNLRSAYGLPTSTDAEAMYAYYFYRLLQRAETATLLYTSAADDRTTGEQSRYIYQLEYESDFEVIKSDISLDISPEINSDFVMAKSTAIIDKLNRKRFAPTALNRYISCGMRFYLNDIAKLTVPDTLDEEFTKLDLGNALHKAMELLYKPLVGLAKPQQKISKITDAQIDLAISDAMVDLASNSQTIESGLSKIGRQMVERYIKQNLRYDSQRSENYIIENLEYEISETIGKTVIYGKLDRVDRLENGSLVIIDYKSGSDKCEFGSIADLFDTTKENRNRAALQMLIYALILSDKERVDVSPQLYIGKIMGRADFSPLLSDKERGIHFLSDEMKYELRERLSEIIDQILDPNTPFVQNKIGRNCEYCDYNSLCNS